MIDTCTHVKKRTHAVAILAGDMLNCGKNLSLHHFILPLDVQVWVAGAIRPEAIRGKKQQHDEPTSDERFYISAEQHFAK